MPVDAAPPIRCLPLILVSMCVTTVVLVHLGSHQKRADEPGASLQSYKDFIPPESVLEPLGLADLHQLLTTYLASIQLDCGQATPIGKKENVNYLCSKLDQDIAGRPCSLHSFGYRGDFSFETEMASKYGCSVYSFDPKNRERSSPDANVKLFDVQLGASDGNVGGVNKKTYSTVRSQTAESSSKVRESYTILKIDVDRADQWDVMKDITRPEVLSGVGYLFIELNTSHDSKAECLADILTLKKLVELGFSIYYYQTTDNQTFKVYMANLVNFR